MLDYLQKFNALPPNVRESISSPGVVAAIKNLEEKYGISLARVIMRIMVKDLVPSDFLRYFTEEVGLDFSRARELSFDLEHSVLFSVAEYIYGAEVAIKQEQLSKEASATAASVNSPKANVTQQISSSKTISGPEEEAKNVLEKSGIMFGSRDLNERLTKILTTYIKGIRDRITTKESLIKPIEAGGMAFDLEVAENLLAITDGEDPIVAAMQQPMVSDPIGATPSEIIKEESKQAVKPSVMDLMAKQNISTGSSTRDTDYDFSELIERSKKLLEQKELNTGDEERLLDGPDMIVATPSKPAKINSSDIVGFVKSQWHAQGKKPSEHPPLGSVLSSSLVGVADEPHYDLSGQQSPDVHSGSFVGQQANSTQTIQQNPEAIAWQKNDAGKVVMNDVLTKPKVYSPIDELRFMTIKNFRNLSTDPEQAVEMVARKIKTIKDEDFTKKVEAINAWKQSPVNRMYVDVCKKGLDTSTPVNKVLAQMLKENSDFLNSAEFESIIKLNKWLTTNI